MKNILYFFFICFLSMQLNAQADAVYRIKLLSVNKNSDLKLFKNLHDLGVVSFEPFDNNTLRVYLGNYIGKFTADRILPTVKARGFTGAYVEKIKDSFVATNGDSLTHTMQFIALKKLDIRTIVNNPKLLETDKKDVFIWYHNGFYRVSMGMIKENESEQIEKFKTKTNELGFSIIFSQKFAGVAPVPETSTISTAPKINFPTEIKKIERKDAFELENKKTPSSTPAVKKNLDPILKEKEAKANPNAKLKPIK